MPTARDFITDAMKLIGALPQGQDLEAEEANDGLRRLNAMLGQWRLEHLMLYTTSPVMFALVPGQAVYTYGPGGNWNGRRPPRIDLVSFKVSQQDLEAPGDVLTEEQWQHIAHKSQGGYWPTCLYPDYAHPVMTCTVYPVPLSGGADQVILYVWGPLSQFDTLSTDLAFPDGYEEAIAFNLAVRLAPYYERPVSSEIATLAIASKARIQNANSRVPTFRLDPALRHRSRYTITTDRGLR